MDNLKLAHSRCNYNRGNADPVSVTLPNDAERE
jgi:hypothetical protein